jgi:HD-GYP domain-containing protein (c-di-GMP phosphodiesterase class II)
LLHLGLVQSGAAAEHEWVATRAATAGRPHDRAEVLPHPSTRLAFVSQERYCVLAGHGEQMSLLAAAMALVLGFGPRRARHLRAASTLHDIGKVVIPDRILLKAAPLTRAEEAIMREHTFAGHALLSGTGDPVLELAATIALSHHERWDGDGYPQRLRGDQIPLVVRVASVADVFDALTHPRPYREAFDEDAALDIVLAGRGTQFEARVVDALLAVRGRGDSRRCHGDRTRDLHLRRADA